MRSERWQTAAAALAIFAVNAYVTLPLFRVDYLNQMGSIEAAFIGLARYIHEHFPDLNWLPLWYGGIPYQDSYPPLLHFLVASVTAAAHISPGLAYHVVTATVYALAPVALFWTACRFGADRVMAFAAALGYSLIAPSCWLVREVRADTGGWFGPRRLVTMVKYGEGPHVTSLLFLALAIGLLHVALEKRRPWYYGLAALGLAAVVLSNWIGGFALAAAVAAYLLAGYRGAWLRAAAIGGAAYAVAMPWITPSTVATIRANAPLVGGKFVADWRLAAAFIIGTSLLAWGMKRLKMEPAVRFGLLFLFAMAFIALAAYWFQAPLLPQPQRYHLEMDLAFWLAAALLAARLRERGRAVVLACAAVVCVAAAVHQHRLAREMERPIDIRSTVEYQTSRWLAENLPGERVFAPGTIGFWMDAFSDTPMLTGGFDNGIRNTFLQDVIFQVYAGDKPEVAVDWLKAFGCDAVVGGDAGSREVYHPYAHPEKFHGLPELWRNGADVVYAVPRRNRSLAHALHLADLPPERPPAYDTASLKTYLAALDDPANPAVQFRWRGGGAATMAGDLRPEDLLSVQVTWDAGWTARVGGEPRRIWGDKLGQMVIEPRCNGPCTVELEYDGGSEMRAARFLSRATLAGGALWILVSAFLWRKRSASAKTKSNYSS